MSSRLASALQSALTVLPGNRQCVLCEQFSTQLICDWCNADLPAFDSTLAHGNALHMPWVRSALHSVHFTELRAMAPYVWPFSDMISRMKFQHSLSDAKALAQLFIQRVVSGCRDVPDLIIPVPLHSRRFVARQYNQSAVIARYLARHLHCDLGTNLITRVRNTQPQTALSGASRRKNLASAFQLRHTPDVRHLVLFDDVITTGSTLNALYRLLRKHCPHTRIQVWALCITPLRQ